MADELISHVEKTFLNVCLNVASRARTLGLQKFRLCFFDYLLDLQLYRLKNETLIDTHDIGN